ncbi:MAG: Opr family porin [Nitrospiraceae bacterium]|nr:MAG: Opr family porin [Nitrospiraceae bacterium]
MQRHLLLTVFSILVTFCTPAIVLSEDDSSNHSLFTTIMEELKRGEVNGTVGLYYELTDYEQSTFVEEEEVMQLDDSRLLIPYFQIEYQSRVYKRFSLGIGFTGYVHIIKDVEEEDAFRDFERFLTHKLFLQYDISKTTLRLGRIELEDSLFLTDYYKALSLSLREIENIGFLFAYIEEVAEADIDKLTDFQDINRGDTSIDDHLVAMEIPVDIIPESFSATLYYYHQGNLYDLYGKHVEFSHNFNEVTLGLYVDYYATHEDSKNGMRNIQDEVEDTDIYHISPFVEYENFALTAGYIQADRNVGAREGGLIDDYFNPFNEGDRVYEPDAKTVYGSVEYHTDHIIVEIVYGETTFRDDLLRLKERELDLNGSLEFWKNVKLETEFAIVNSESPEGDFVLLETALTYEF